MEVVGAGASIISIIGLALQCTKSLYQIISSYQNAPQQFDSLASAIKHLERILTQLQGCKALSDPSVDYHNITELIKTCTADLRRYENTLQKLQPDRKTPKAKQIWKRCTATWGEKSVNQIWIEVNQHCTALGVQLQLLQRYVMVPRRIFI